MLPTAEWADEPLPAPGPRHTHDMVIYEVHVKGFTARANSGVAEELRGTFRGLIEKIDHLKDLGVTVVELLPVHQYDPQEGNYWGYMTMNFFAPHSEYAHADAVAEFREMADALHAAGIELWLDVVYNHTAEGDHTGPTYNLAGHRQRLVLHRRPGRLVRERHRLRQHHPGRGHRHPRAGAAQPRATGPSRWASTGSASTSPRSSPATPTGAVEGDMPPMINEIGILAGTHDLRVTAEAWDLGAYQLGRGFPGIMWRQWNGRFRDDVRGFVKGDDGLVGALMSRVYGSADLFPDGPNDMYRPYQSVNFVTAHDGFCLYDLVSYNERHNEANGHGGTDGSSDNLSWNCGWEGDEGAPPEVLALRMRQMKNFAALMMLSNGVPMIVAGDEFANTQRGNNNPYNQDNEITWLDWDRLDSHRDLYEFFKAMIALRKGAPQHRPQPVLARGRARGSAPPARPTPRPGRTAWPGTCPGARYGEGDLYVMVNAH